MAKLAAKLLPGATKSFVRAKVRAVRGDIRLARALVADWRRYRGRSGLLGCKSRPALEARIIKTYHRIEKGLALPSPRAGFGIDAIELLKADLADYVRRFGCDRSTRAALNALREYVAFNDKHNVDTSAVRAFLDSMDDLHGEAAEHAEGGTFEIARDTILAAGRQDLRAFFASRYSIRQFSDDPVDLRLIERAVAMAQKTPSVCNRESGRVFVVGDAEQKGRLLQFQNGNRGFGDAADKLLIVGSSLACFHTVGERYQAWIDGGMFAMSLVYALHSMGVGTCCLNWSVEPDADAAFRQAAGLPDDIQVIMLIAVGHLPPNLRIAQSPRRPLEGVLHILGAEQRNGV